MSLGVEFPLIVSPDRTAKQARALILNVRGRVGSSPAAVQHLSRQSGRTMGLKPFEIRVERTRWDVNYPGIEVRVLRLDSMLALFCVRSRVPVHAACDAACRHSRGNERYGLLQQLARTLPVYDSVARGGE